MTVLRLIPYLEIRLTWKTTFLDTVKLEMASTKILARVCEIEILIQKPPHLYHLHALEWTLSLASLGLFMT